MTIPPEPELSEAMRRFRLRNFEITRVLPLAYNFPDLDLGAVEQADLESVERAATRYSLVSESLRIALLVEANEWILTGQELGYFSSEIGLLLAPLSPVPALIADTVLDGPKGLDFVPVEPTEFPNRLMRAWLDLSRSRLRVLDILVFESDDDWNEDFAAARNELTEAVSRVRNQGWERASRDLIGPRADLLYRGADSSLSPDGLPSDWRTNSGLLGHDQAVSRIRQARALDRELALSLPSLLSPPPEEFPFATT